eukprot:18667-Heterococcus_DN1.PRE.2
MNIQCQQPVVSTTACNSSVVLQRCEACDRAQAQTLSKDIDYCTSIRSELYKCRATQATVDYFTATSCKLTQLPVSHMFTNCSAC